jgi:hypothetical protein
MSWDCCVFLIFLVPDVEGLVRELSRMARPAESSR